MTKGRDVYKYEKIYNRDGVLTKKNMGSHSWDSASNEFKNKWKKYGHSVEGKEYTSDILSLSPSRVLDVGCGWNEFSDILKTHDIDAVGLDCACPGADVIAPAHDIPFDDDSFDLVVSFDCIEHIPEEEIPLSFLEFSRVSSEVFLKISLTHNTTFIDGEMLHVCVKPEEWWGDVADDYFNIKRKSIHQKNTPWEHLILHGIVL